MVADAANKILSAFYNGKFIHPLECDGSMYTEKIKTLIGASDEKFKQQKETMDLFAKMKSALTENNFAFYNPVCFLEKLDGAGLMEFNPYEGKHIQALHNASNVNLDLAHHNSGFDAVSCPGFAPAVTSASGVNAQKYPFEYNGLNFATVNYCYMCSIYEKEEGKPHTGVDLFGAKGTPIYSMIRGKVWATSFMGDPREGGHGGTSYGRVMLIKGDNGKLYLLAHLSEYKKQKGAPVFPNEIVALAGNTGGSKGDHLHLEVFECTTDIKNVININADENVEMKWSKVFLHRSKRVNPFNHNEHGG